MTHAEYVAALAAALDHTRTMAEACRADGQTIVAMNWECDMKALHDCLDAALEHRNADLAAHCARRSGTFE